MSSATAVVKPSETSSGRAWLANFSEFEAAAATILIDSLRFVGLSSMSRGLKARINGLEAEGQIRTPTLVVPERSLGSFGLHGSHRAKAAGFVDFDPGAPITVTPGSDGFIGGILRDFARAGRETADSPFIAPDATIELLREKQCRSIVVVTDYVGSGDQVLTFAQALARNPTIRSWRSLHRIEICVLAYAASPRALARLGTSRAVDKAWSIEAAPDFDNAPWTPDLRESIVELCQVHCRVAKKAALGYGKSAGLFVTERGAPNNVPAVLWQSFPTWRALFPNRTVPALLAEELRDHRVSEPLPELAARVGQVRLGRNERLGHMRPQSRELLRVLVLLHERARTSPELAAELGVDIRQTAVILVTLRALGFVDAAGLVTDLGRKEIRANRRGLRRVTADLVGVGDTYYPHGLR